MSKIAYSPTEQRLLELLRTKRQLDTNELVELYYNGATEQRPWHADTVIRNGMRSLMRKVEHNREAFAIAHSREPGRKPLMYRYFAQRVRNNRKTARTH